MIKGKKARIFFIAIVITVAIVSIALMYAGYRRLNRSHQSSITDGFVAETLSKYIEGEIVQAHADFSAKLSAERAMLLLPFVMKTNCTTPAGVPLAKPGCNLDNTSIAADFCRLFIRGLKDYALPEDVFSGNRGALKYPQDYECYFDAEAGKVRVHAVAMGVIQLKSGNVSHFITPSVSAPLAYNPVEEAARVYNQAKALGEKCKDKQDFDAFRGCVVQGFAALNSGDEGWLLIEDGYSLTEPLALPIFALKLADDYAACALSQDLFCACYLNQSFFRKYYNDNGYFKGKLNATLLASPGQIGRLNFSAFTPNQEFIIQPDFNGTLCRYAGKSILTGDEQHQYSIKAIEFNPEFNPRSKNVAVGFLQKGDTNFHLIDYFNETITILRYNYKFEGKNLNRTCISKAKKEEIVNMFKTLGMTGNDVSPCKTHPYLHILVISKNSVPYLSESKSVEKMPVQYLIALEMPQN